MRIWLALSCFLLACPATGGGDDDDATDPPAEADVVIEGTVDGHTIPADLDAVMFESELGFAIILGNLPDMCATLTDYWAARSAASSDEYGDIWVQHLSAWTTRFNLMFLGDVTTSMVGTELDFGADGEGVDDGADGGMEFDRYLQPLDAEFYENYDYATYFWSGRSYGGGLSITEHEPGVSISGTFETEIAQNGNTDVRYPVSGSFTAVRCVEMEGVGYFGF